MNIEALALRTGKELQLVIAAAADLPSTLAPLRARRARRHVKLAAVGSGAASAVVGGALLAANLGFWASIGAALGLGSVPLLVTLAGAGSLAMGLPRRKSRSPDLYAKQRDLVELTFCCFQRMAEADGRISDEEKLLLRSVLLQFPLLAEDRMRIQDAAPDKTMAQSVSLDEGLRRQVLRGTWMLAEADGVTAEEENLFAGLAAQLGLTNDVAQLKRESRDMQGAANDLVTAMFRTCQQVLAPTLGQPAANEFLESLAQIAATPLARRSLRNSLRSGYSAGGVVRTLDEHREASKLVAQAYNGVRAVYGASTSARKEGRTRLLELTENAALGVRAARKICADIDTLFEEALGAAVRAEESVAARPEQPG